MSRHIDVIAVPSEMGGQNGTESGPEMLRSPLLLSITSAKFSCAYENIRGRTKATEFFSAKGKPRGKVHYQKNVAGIANVTAESVTTSICCGHTPAVIGGDHSVSVGSVRGALDFAFAHKQKIALVWIDAHLDSHTPLTTRSHNANGMPLATLLGHGPRAFRPTGRAFLPEHVIHLGAGTTDCEPEEKVLLDKLGVRTFSAETLRRDPMPAWIATLALVDRCDLVWVSLDLDAIDRHFAPGVHLQSNGGLDRAFLLWFAGHMGVGKKLCGVDIMEYKPSSEEYDERGDGKTARLASDFLLALLGS